MLNYTSCIQHWQQDIKRKRVPTKLYKYNMLKRKNRNKENPILIDNKEILSQTALSFLLSWNDRCIAS